jgi:hypothetical protein
MATKTKTSNLGGGFPREIGKPATNALNHVGFTDLKQLTKATEAELLALHGFGPKALGILQAALKERGWTFAKSDAKPQRKRTPRQSPAVSQK